MYVIRWRRVHSFPFRVEVESLSLVSHLCDIAPKLWYVISAFRSGSLEDAVGSSVADSKFRNGPLRRYETDVG